MSSITFTVRGAVAGQGSMAAVVNRRGQLWMKHDSPKTEPWRQTVGYAARRAMRGQAMLTGPLDLNLLFFLPRPKSAPVSRALPETKPDLDKLCRAIGDALEGIVFVNDSRIVRLAALKLYATEENPVGASISVKELGHER